MKECKVLHINDGTPRELTNGNWHFMEEYEWMGEAIQEHLDEGYEVKHLVNTICPARLEDGIAFYMSGVTVYLERETDEPLEDWTAGDPEDEVPGDCGE